MLKKILQENLGAQEWSISKHFSKYKAFDSFTIGDMVSKLPFMK